MPVTPAQEVVAYIQSHERELIDFLRELVECESPSDTPAAVDRFGELFTDRLNGLARVKAIRAPGFGKHLRCEFKLPGRGKPGNGKSGQIMALGHSDTVWPMGTLRSMPWREADGRLWGPGVLDMKGGLAFFVFAMRALAELKIPVQRHVVLVVNSDEEVGSISSRPLTEAEARKSEAVLVLEPGTGLGGKLKTARKGVGFYHLTARGVSSHAGVDFAAGANAIVELARQLPVVAGFTDLDRGVTVNPGVITGGTRTNVVPETASAGIDFRVPTMRAFTALEKKFRKLKPHDARCTLELTGGLNRPPMERSAGVVRLFKLAKSLAKPIGVTLEESSTGGGSDGNFTAGLGIPTLDGIGAVGEGAHASHESILTDRIVDRTAVLALLVANL